MVQDPCALLEKQLGGPQARLICTSDACMKAMKPQPTCQHIRTAAHLGLLLFGLQCCGSTGTELKDGVLALYNALFGLGEQPFLSWRDFWLHYVYREACPGSLNYVNKLCQ